MFVTGSVKGLPNEGSEIYNSPIYCYIKVVIDSKTYYFDKDCSLTDHTYAAIFGQKEARKLVSKMRNKYSNISIFRTTKKLASS